MLIGLEVIAIAADPKLILIGAAAIPLIMLARILSVGAPLLVMRPLLSLGPMAMPILVWGGLRGGISVALALSLPESTMRTIILATTYMVVMFSVIVQGGSVGRLISKLTGSAIVQDAHRD